LELAILKSLIGQQYVLIYRLSYTSVVQICICSVTSNPFMISVTFCHSLPHNMTLTGSRFSSKWNSALCLPHSEWCCLTGTSKLSATYYSFIL